MPSESSARILICDDEAVARRGARRALSTCGYDFIECDGGQACLDALAKEHVDLVLLDLRMPGLDGFATLEAIGKMQEPPPVVVITADASIQSAIEAVKKGAQNYLSKPYDIEELRLVVSKTLDTARLRNENTQLRTELKRVLGSSSLLGQSTAMREVSEVIARVAPTTASVLITGETGTGKELAARAIHDLSDVSAGPFVTMNCAAIPENLVESELFGHSKGAFTGAHRDRMGRFQEANRGTLFLDEVGDMPRAAQAKLLRVLQDGVVEPVGGGRSLQVKVRVLAATHHDLKQRVAEDAFREDLLYRLRVVELPMPALRERDNDILLLATQFLQQTGRRGLDITPEILPPLWRGEKMDHSLAVLGLVSRE